MKATTLQGLLRWASYFAAQNITDDFPALLATMQKTPPIDFRLNPVADLYPLLKQRLRAVGATLQARNAESRHPPVALEEIPWYPKAGCGWRLRLCDAPDLAGTNASSGSAGALETAISEEPGFGVRNEPNLLRMLVEQQNRGALARQELVSMLPVALLGGVDKEERLLDLCASPGRCVCLRPPSPSLPPSSFLPPRPPSLPPPSSPPALVLPRSSPPSSLASIYLSINLSI